MASALHIYTDPIFLEHDTGHHPENAGRLIAVEPLIKQWHSDPRCDFPGWEPAGTRLLELVHAPTYINALRGLAEQGGGRWDGDTVVSCRSFDAACMAAGAVSDAVDKVLHGTTRHALCLVRPPGHHALVDDAMGFCLFNNVAIGARRAIVDFKLDRVLIVDWDVHHGNGTQDIFWEDGQVGFFSSHRYPFWPGSGSALEVGAGAGQGMTRNLPIAFGTSRTDYLNQFANQLQDFARVVRPQLVLISAGFDSHHLDPIGSLELESEDFGTLTDLVLDVARTYASDRVVSVLEGGYHPPALRESIDRHAARLLEPCHL